MTGGMCPSGKCWGGTCPGGGGGGGLSCHPKVHVYKVSLIKRNY